MVIFFGLLFGLLVINALLLVFSVNGAGEQFRKSLQKKSGTSITKLFPRESSETVYKKAV